LVQSAWNHIEEIEKLGGLTKAIETGIPKLRIEKAAARKQARIDSEQDVIVGLNKYQLEKEDSIRVLEVDNFKVRQQQLERLKQIKSTRNNDLVHESLGKLTQCAKTGEGNLLELAIHAARNRATLGEISDALETVFGRYEAQIKMVNNVYGNEIKNDIKFEKAKQLAKEFYKTKGCAPRILIAKMGQDGHDRGSKVIATAYTDIGFEVYLSPLFQTPEEIVEKALINNVHALGISSLAAGHKTFVPQVISGLKEFKREDIKVIVGGVIPPRDYQFLFDAGVVAVFGPGTKISESAIRILENLVDDKN
jgi:methylmalonyl-CoA mutase